MNTFKLLLAASAIGLSAPAMAAPIIGLYNTGVMSGGAMWGVGGGVTAGTVADPHWTMTALTGTAPSGAFNTVGLNSSWAPDNMVSRWATTEIGNATFDPKAAGTYSYTLGFNLNGPTASFTGRYLSDNRVTSIKLNGTEIVGAPGFGFNSLAWDAFSSVPGAFKVGANLLEFTVQNDAQLGGNPTGLRVEFLTSNVVPEPATWAMMILGFGVIGGAMRRRKAAAVRVTYA